MNEARKKTRRRYGSELKQQILAECVEPGVESAEQCAILMRELLK